MGFDEIFQQSGDARAFIESAVKSRNLLPWQMSGVPKVWLCDYRSSNLMGLDAETLTLASLGPCPYHSQGFAPQSIGGDGSVIYVSVLKGDGPCHVLELAADFSLVRIWASFFNPVFLGCGGDALVWYLGTNSGYGASGWHQVVEGRRRSDGELFTEGRFIYGEGAIRGAGGGYGTLWTYEEREAPRMSQVQRRHPLYTGTLISSVDAPGLEPYQDYEDIGGGGSGVWVCDSAGEGWVLELAMPAGAAIVRKVDSPGVAPVGVGGKR